MRILLLSHYYPPETGAPQRRLRALVPLWTERGIDIHVIAPLSHYPSGHLLSGSWREIFRPGPGEYGEEVTRVPFLPRSAQGLSKFLDQLVAASASLLPAVRLRKPDLVLASVPGIPSAATAWLVARRWGVPFILEMRDAWPDLLYQQRFGPWPISTLVGRVLEELQHKANAIVTIARDFGDILAQRRGDSRTVEHIPNGIEPSSVPELPAPSTDDRLRILYLGTHGVSQGLDSVVRAIARLDPSGVEVRFIGDGSESNHLQELAQDLGAPIQFRPPVTGPALWEAYEWAHTCLVPLRDWPAFKYTVPSKLYEIMASGRHVTACVEGEAARIVREAGGGTVLPPENSIELASHLERLRNHQNECQVGPGPRDWVLENASYTELAARYIKLFERVLQ